MKDIKEKQRDKSIKLVNKKSVLEHSIKKKIVHTKDKVSTHEKTNDPSLDANQQAVETTNNRAKKTASESILRGYKAVGYLHKKRKLFKIRKEERAISDHPSKVTHPTIQPEPKVNQTPNYKQVHRREPLQSIEPSKTMVHKDRNKTIKQKDSKITFSHKSMHRKEHKKDNHILQRQKGYAIKKHQKKLKEARQTASFFTSKTGTTVSRVMNGSVQVIRKTISNVHLLYSLGGALVFLLVLTLFLGVFASLSSDSSPDTAIDSLSEEVYAYNNEITKYAQKYNISEYKALIQAVMMQESGGKGNDPMQASECEYNTLYPKKPGGITNPEYSIEVGIQYLADCIKKAEVKEAYAIKEISLALQGYNYGVGYIDWAMKHFDGYTAANAKVFSDEMKAKNQVDVYGDPQYVSHVLRYYHMNSSEIVTIALSQVGNIGGKPYWQWYGFQNRVEWCACFVSWCAQQAGLIEKGVIPKFAFCPSGIKWFQEHNRWQKNGSIPNSGDIIFFDWEGDGISDHVGIVEKVENDIVHTIEGNSDQDECRRKSYPLSSIYIVGYGTLS